MMVITFGKIIYALIITDYFWIMTEIIIFLICSCFIMKLFGLFLDQIELSEFVGAGLTLENVVGRKNKNSEKDI